MRSSLAYYYWLKKNSVDNILCFSILIADRKVFQGILKPQGSLERNRDSLTNTVTEISNVEANILPCVRKPRQNIAMQAIMRRAETEQKQVTFKNVSPVIVEEDNDRKAKAAIVPPVGTCITAPKPIPMPEMVKVDDNSVANTLVTTQTRPVMPLASSAVGQNQSASMQSQQRVPKLPPNIPMPGQLTGKEQAQQILSQMPTSPMGGSVCYANQSFNVQNPQFTKNFMTNRPTVSSVPRYQIQGQLSNSQQPTAAMSQPIGAVHHAINQSRQLHQRMPQNVSHSPAQLLQQQQNMRLGSPAQQGILPQGINLQTANVGLQSSMNVDQQSHAMGLQTQQQNIIQSNGRLTNAMHNQLNVNGAAAMANVSMMPVLSSYKKDPTQQQQQVNSPSPTAASNFQLNFNQSNFGQNAFGCPTLPQNQPSPSFYKKNEMVDFAFPSQVNMTKNQSQQQQSPANNYNMFCNYEPTEHFNLWKDNRPPQPPITWWGPSAGNTTQMHMKDSIGVDNAFSNWSDSSNSGNMANRIPLTPGKNYQQQNGRHLVGGSNFEDSRPFEVSTIIFCRIE